MSTELNDCFSEGLEIEREGGVEALLHPHRI